MADNTQLNAGSGGDLFRTLDDGAVKWPVGVTAFAETVGDPDGLAIVTPAAGLPVHQQTGATWAVTGPLTDAQLRAAAVPVTGPLTDAQLRAVAVSVAGPLTDTQLRAAAVPVSLTSIPSHPVTNAGTFAVQATQAGAWTVQPGNTANTTPWLTSDRPATSGGLSMHKLVSAASTNPTLVKNAPGQVYDVQVFNTSASPRYLKLYNKASAPAVGTDTPVKTLLIPGNTAGAGVVKEWAKGLEFAAGIAYAVTTGAADTDATAVGAGEVVINIDYK